MMRWHCNRRRRQNFASVVAFFCICLFLLISHDRFYYPTIAIYRRQIHARSADPLHLQHVDLWKALHGLILNNHPRCENRPELVVPREPRIVFDPGHEHQRPDVLWINDADLSRLRSAHTNFVKDISATTSKLAYNAGTQGIVLTASDDLLTTLAISLSMLRRTGSALPVEVFLNKPSSYTDNYCLTVLHRLNAKCRFLSDIFIAGDTAVELHSYQFKIFSIIFSSFENILLLDSDAWPITQPEYLFQSRPFVDSGLVLWPDFWYASESPYFFDVAKIENVPALNHRPASESGEIMYSKSKHTKSLMLSAYYNYYGPEYYYLLHSQGGPGEGDKETFVWAAAALNEDHYFVQQGVNSLGRHDSNGNYIGSAMLQFDPVQDFLQNTKIPDLQSAADSSPTQKLPVTPRPLFVHANHPKFNPYAIFDKSENERSGAVQDSDGEWVRSWLPRDKALQLFGTDIEHSLWQTIQTVTCDILQGIGLPADTYDRAGLDVIRKRDRQVCDSVSKYITTVFDEPLRKTQELGDVNDYAYD